MEQNKFTGVFNTDMLILLQLDNTSLCKVCQTNKYIHKICQDERFWQAKVRTEYGDEIIMHKPVEITYHEQYVDLKTINLRPSSHNEIISIVKNKRYDIILANLNYFTTKDPITILTYTAESGNLDLLKFLYSLNINKFKGLGSFLDNAAAGGNIEMVKFLMEMGNKTTQNTVDRAIYNKHFELVKWFVNNKILPSGLGIHSLVKDGDIDMLEWLDKHGIKLEQYHDLYSAAAEGGHVNMLNWLESHNIFINEHSLAVYEASEHGHIDVLEWLAARNIFPKETDIRTAAFNNQLNVLEWMKNNGFFTLTYDPNDNELMCIVSRYGYLDVIKWLVNNGFKINKYVPNYALEGGHIEVLDWLYDQGFTPSEDEMMYAKERENVEIKNWLIEKRLM